MTDTDISLTCVYLLAGLTYGVVAWLIGYAIGYYHGAWNDDRE